MQVHKFEKKKRPNIILGWIQMARCWSLKKKKAKLAIDVSTFLLLLEVSTDMMHSLCNIFEMTWEVTERIEFFQ